MSLLIAARLLCLHYLGIAVALQAARDDDPETVVKHALTNLRKMWPGDGERILSVAAEAMPHRDNGTALKERLEERYYSHKPFVFAAFGSSVSAGHDNFPNQSWPFELERLLAPTFKALGFDFQVRQRAMGGYGEMPFAAGCLAGRAGSGLDAVSWEHGMFYDGACEGYHFLREVAAMPGQPVVFALAGTSIEFEDALQLPNEERRGKRGHLLARNDDAEFGDQRVWHENSWYFSNAFVSPKELKNWESSSGYKKKRVVEVTPEHYLQQTGAAAVFDDGSFGFYPISTAAATNAVIDNPWYQAREKALNINWHPGPLGHTLIASQLAHFILSNLQSIVPSATRARVVPKKHEGQNPLVGKDKMPKLPDGQMCGSMMSVQCSTGVELPTSTLRSMRSRSSEDTWEFGRSIQTITGWMGQIDQRMVFRGTKESGKLTLDVNVPGKKEHYALVCEAPCGWGCSEGFGYVAAKSQRWWPEHGPHRKERSDLSFSVDGRTVSDTDLLQLHKLLFDAKTGSYCPGCMNAADICQPVAKLAPGKHSVGMEVHPQSHNKPGMYVEVVQVMLVAEP